MNQDKELEYETKMISSKRAASFLVQNIDSSTIKPDLS